MEYSVQSTKVKGYMSIDTVQYDVHYGLREG